MIIDLKERGVHALFSNDTRSMMIDLKEHGVHVHVLNMVFITWCREIEFTFGKILLSQILLSFEF